MFAQALIHKLLHLPKEQLLWLTPQESEAHPGIHQPGQKPLKAESVKAERRGLVVDLQEQVTLQLGYAELNDSNPFRVNRSLNKASAEMLSLRSRSCSETNNYIRPNKQAHWCLVVFQLFRVPISKLQYPLLGPMVPFLTKKPPTTHHTPLLGSSQSDFALFLLEKKKYDCDCVCVCLTHLGSSFRKCCHETTRAGQPLARSSELHRASERRLTDRTGTCARGR